MGAIDPSDLAAARLAAVVLDVRSEEEFARGHLPGSGHLPLPELRERRSELPPRDTRLLIAAASGAQARAAAAAVADLGYPRVDWLDAAVAEATAELVAGEPAARLWRPSPFLEQVLLRLPAPAPDARVLDLAAGAGREAVFLALQGYAVEAWDHDRDVLERAAALAARHRVTIATRTYNLERLEPELPKADRAVVMVFRFLHRPLFPHIERAIAPGGCLVYETYLRGQERFGRPRHPRFLLDPDELLHAFPTLEVEHYEESRPEPGPFAARLLARRRS